jgi:hypothetical protein
MTAKVDRWLTKTNATLRFWTDDHMIGIRECRVWVYEQDKAPIEIVAIDEGDSLAIATAANREVGIELGSHAYRREFFGLRTMIFLDSRPRTYSVTSMGNTQVISSWLEPQNNWLSRQGTLPVMLFGAKGGGDCHTRSGRPEAHGLPPIESGKVGVFPRVAT